MAKDTTHPVTVAGVLTVTLTRWHQAVEVCVDGASPVYATLDPTFSGSSTPAPSAAADETEWIGANSSQILANKGIPPDQGAGFSDTTTVWIYCAAAGVQLHVHGR